MRKQGISSSSSSSSNRTGGKGKGAVSGNEDGGPGGRQRIEEKRRGRHDEGKSMEQREDNGKGKGGKKGMRRRRTTSRQWSEIEIGQRRRLDIGLEHKEVEKWEQEGEENENEEDGNETTEERIRDRRGWKNDKGEKLEGGAEGGKEGTTSDGDGEEGVSGKRRFDPNPERYIQGRERTVYT